MGPVIIVDDDVDVCRMLEQFLLSHGYQVVTACNGADALQAMRDRKPCLVLLDVLMPVMDGWQFRRHQLANADLAKIPVLCMTAAYDPHHVALELKTRCLRKPVDLDDVLREVEAACARSEGAVRPT
jgi:DNA-binding response OmpR family regulator